jgi:hypothetical protein
LDRKIVDYYTEQSRIFCEEDDGIFGILMKNKVKKGFASPRSKKRRMRKDADLFPVCDGKRRVNNTKWILIWLREVNNRKRERCEMSWPSSTADSI